MQTGKLLLNFSKMQSLAYILHGKTIKRNTDSQEFEKKDDFTNHKRSCQSFRCGHMLNGRGEFTERFIFSDSDLLSEIFNQVNQVPLDKMTACQRNLFK